MATPRWLDEREAHLWRSWLRVAHELPRALEDGTQKLSVED